MKRLKLGVAVITVFMATLISGCTPIENYFVKDAPDYAKVANTPLTAIEYTNKINRTLVPLLSDGETYLSHHLDIVKGKFPKAQESAMVENTINKIQTAIEEIDALYQPAQYSDHKAETIMLLNQYKDAMRRYKEALDSGDVDSIKLAADGIKNASASLKGAYSIYQK